MYIAFCTRAPEDRAIEHSAVLKTVGKSAYINCPAISEVIYGKLYILVVLDQDLCPFESIDILLAFSEINISADIFRYEMIVLFPVVFIVSQREISFFINTEYIGQLEEMSL